LNAVHSSWWSWRTHLIRMLSQPNLSSLVARRRDREVQGKILPWWSSRLHVAVDGAHGDSIVALVYSSNSGCRCSPRIRCVVCYCEPSIMPAEARTVYPTERADTWQERFTSVVASIVWPGEVRSLLERNDNRPLFAGITICAVTD
jgi:hypothetical protein